MIDDPRLDPTIRAILEAAEVMDAPPLETLSPVEARRAAIDRGAPCKGQPEELASVEDRVISGPGGPIPIRIYFSLLERVRPAPRWSTFMAADGWFATWTPTTSSAAPSHGGRGRWWSRSITDWRQSISSRPP